MDIFEFELRYKAYAWLSRRLHMNLSQDVLLDLVKRTDTGALTNALVDSSIEELRDATKRTYTTTKKDFIGAHSEQKEPLSQKSLADYIERLEYELKVIHEMGYNTYFLIVQDYINRAKEQEIVVWPGRWSVAGSLLSYLIGITDIDPLAYDLIFERFLNPWRISMPDIDTDFEDTQRDKVIDYIKHRYGEDKVAHIGTYMTMAARAAFKDVARVYGINFDQSNKLSWLITEKTIAESVEANKELKESIATDTRLKKVIDTAIALEGTVRQTGVHACGMIIAPEPTVCYSPIQYPPLSWSKDTRDETRVVSQYEGPVIENLGLLKMDILWLRNLSIIKNTIKILKAKALKNNETLDPMFTEFLDTMLFHPPLDDEFTYKTIFHTGNTSWVFQFESDGMKNRLKKLKPTVFDDLIAMVSLYRPWPMEFIPFYVDRKHGVEQVQYMQSELRQELISKYDEETAKQEQQKLEDDLSPFLGITYGIAVYQEQLMRIVQAMAWFSMSEADKLRKWVGKKIKEVIEKVKVEFIEKCKQHREYKEETSRRVYEKMIEPAANYSFNKSHAACYAYISYQTAYLKAHFPLEFHAALLRSVEEDTDKLAKFIDEIKLQWLEVRPPDINVSFDHVAALHDAVYLWFRSIKGIWSEISKCIEETRTAKGPYTSLEDFLSKCGDSLNKKSLEALAKSGALDAFEDRFTLLANISRMIERIKTSSQQQAWLGLFAMDAVQWWWLTLDKARDEGFIAKLKLEQEIFKTIISGHPFDGMYAYMKRKYNFISMMKDVENYGDFIIVGFIKQVVRGMRGGFYIKLEDISWEMELYINEKLDFEPFDILVVHGRKGRSPRMEEVKAFTYDEYRSMIEKSGSFDPEKTVTVVRKERASWEQPEEAPQSKSSVPTPQAVAENEPVVSPTNVDATRPTHFKAPDDIGLLAKLPVLIKNHPWSNTITIGTLEVSVDDIARQEIIQLCKPA